jgi:hypothetical protein
MSVRRCQSEVSSVEFGEWLAIWQLEAEESGEGEPDVGAKLAAWAASSAAQPGVTTLERRR